jgi:hypothetical protein
LFVPGEGVGATPSDQSGRLAVVRSVSDVKAAVGMLNAAYAVLVVIRTSESDRRRVIDLLAGWSLGAGGEADWIGPNAVLLRSPGTAPVHVGRSGLVSAVDDAFAGDDGRRISRGEEERLLRQAIGGSVTARRRLIDTYAELATMYALRIRPTGMGEATAVSTAQAELERLVAFPSKGPLLANLFDGIATLLLD